MAIYVKILFLAVSGHFKAFLKPEQKYGILVHIYLNICGRDAYSSDTPHSDQIDQILPVDMLSLQFSEEPYPCFGCSQFGLNLNLSNDITPTPVVDSFCPLWDGI